MAEKYIEKYKSPNTTKELQNKIIDWADNKSLLTKDNSYKQLAKTIEELGEVARALIHNDIPEIKDGIGDVVVTLIILAKQNGLDFNDCLLTAWNEIKSRTGKTLNGVFIKDKE